MRKIEDVGGDFGPGRFFEGGCGKAEASDEIGLLRQVFPHFGPGGIRRVMAGDGDQEPARLQGIDGPGKEIVVDVEAGIILVLGVVDLEIPEGEVGDDQIHGVVVDLRGLLKSFDKGFRFRIELGEDEPADPVFFHGHDPGVFGDAPGA